MLMMAEAVVVVLGTTHFSSPDAKQFRVEHLSTHLCILAMAIINGKIGGYVWIHFEYCCCPAAFYCFYNFSVCWWSVCHCHCQSIVVEDLESVPPEVFCCSMILHLNGSGNCGNYCRQYHLFVYVCAGDCSRFIHFDQSVLRLLWWSAVSSDKCQQQPKAKDGAIIESINRHTLTHSQIGSKLGERPHRQTDTDCEIGGPFCVCDFDFVSSMTIFEWPTGEMMAVIKSHSAFVRRQLHYLVKYFAAFSLLLNCYCCCCNYLLTMLKMRLRWSAS